MQRPSRPHGTCEDWRAEYGGSLELWDEGMTTREHDIVPLFNRCVIFNTTSNSQHGNPQAGLCRLPGSELPVQPGG